MPDNQYPVFEGGQTLTAADLNQLRAFGHARDRVLGRLTGFGVGCGLTGTVTGSTLTIAPGLAVDQAGEPMMLPAARTIALPPTPSSGTFAFVTAAGGGFSVVLESTDTVEPTPDCGEVDCEGHAELHTRGVTLRVVPGRITGPRFDFAGEPLLAVEPLRLSLTSNPQGSYTTLRNTIATRLANNGSPLINPALIAQLSETSIATSDLPGVKGYKAGFLNQVLFAALDLLRCRALAATACDRSTPRPGVVLGWVRQVSGTWTWECQYRHAWEPLPGLSLALVGGTCGDPCGIWVDALEGLISGYAPPDPPPLEEPDDGGVVVYPVCPLGMVLIKGKCVNIYFPPPEIPDRWRRPWEIDQLNPLDPIWNPPNIREHFDELVRDVYETDPWEYFGIGTVSALPALGRDVALAKGSLEATITELGGLASVLVATAAEATAMPGYQPGATFNTADTVVMTVGMNNKVVAIGRIPAAHTAREIGTALPAATAAAAEAVAVTATIPSMVTTAVDERAGGFRELETAVKEVLTQAGSVLSDGALQGAIKSVVDERMKLVDTTIGGLQTQINNLYMVRGDVGNAGKLGPTQGMRLDQDMSLAITTFADTITQGLEGLVTPENERTLGQHLKRVHTQAAQLEAIATAGEPSAIGDATVQLLSTLRTAVKSAGIDKAVGRELDVQLNVVKGLLG